MTMTVWNPQKGAMPQKMPSATDRDLTSLEALLSKRSSLMKRFRLFFLSYERSFEV